MRKGSQSRQKTHGGTFRESFQVNLDLFTSLPIRQLDEQLGLTQQFAEALVDPRVQGYVDHTFLEMARARIYGILADYEDQNDHDVLNSDPIF